MSLRWTQAHEPPLLELCRFGALLTAGTSAATNGRAGVVDIPTTTANWLLQNPAVSSKKLVLLKAGFWFSSGTAATGVSMIAGVTPSPLTASNQVTANATGHTTGSLRGTPISGAGPFLGVNVTVPTMAANFMMIGGMDCVADTTVGLGSPMYDCGGAFVVPPGYGLAVDIINGAGTNPKWAISLLLASLDLDME